jgi:exportin-2 (importin alpha re-exporter)
MQFRPVDMEIFTNEPEEYILRDMEGSDMETRRRGAFDLVRALCKLFENEVTNIFAGFIGTLLEVWRGEGWGTSNQPIVTLTRLSFTQRYAANPSGEWQSKDVAEYLVVSLVSWRHVL